MNKAELLRQWRRRYFFHMFLCICILAVGYIVGAFLCSQIVWYSEDPEYLIFKWMQAHVVTITLVCVFLIAIADALRMFAKIADGMEKVQMSVPKMYSDKNELIELPKQFTELERQMNQVRLQNYTNAQAAKEANQRKNDMIMYMAHDLKTPLTSVIGYLTLVSQEPDIPEDARKKYIDIALKKALHLEDLINEFFDITRFNFTHMFLEKSKINLSMMLEQMVSEFAQEFRKKNLTAGLQIEDHIEMLCDVEKMERVFDNLLKNIVNYSYPDTKIEVSMNKTPEGNIRIVTTNHGKTIPEEMQEHIFEQFFRMDSSRNSDTGGSGLGLAVTREIVELHGGTIRCQSRMEEIQFIIELPGGLKEN